MSRAAMIANDQGGNPLRLLGWIAAVVTLALLLSPGSWSGRSGWEAWLRPDLDARTWRAFADTLEQLRSEIELTKLEPRDCLSAPVWSELRSRFAGAHAGLFSAPEAASRLAAALARHDLDISLARAALRARFEGLRAAQAFLATQLDPFTGSAPGAELEPDGSILLSPADTDACPMPGCFPTDPPNRAWRIRR